MQHNYSTFIAIRAKRKRLMRGLTTLGHNCKQAASYLQSMYPELFLPKGYYDNYDYEHSQLN